MGFNQVTYSTFVFVFVLIFFFVLCVIPLFACVFLLCRSVSETAAEYGNCSLLFSATDTNNNGYVGLHETIVAFAKTNAFDFDANIAPDIKIQQINCSGCVGNNSTLYYM